MINRLSLLLTKNIQKGQKLIKIKKGDIFLEKCLMQVINRNNIYPSLKRGYPLRSFQYHDSVYKINHIYKFSQMKNNEPNNNDNNPSSNNNNKEDQNQQKIKIQKNQKIKSSQAQTSQPKPKYYQQIHNTPGQYNSFIQYTKLHKRDLKISIVIVSLATFIIFLITMIAIEEDPFYIANDRSKRSRQNTNQQNGQSVNSSYPKKIKKKKRFVFIKRDAQHHLVGQQSLSVFSKHFPNTIIRVQQFTEQQNKIKIGGLTLTASHKDDKYNQIKDRIIKGYVQLLRDMLKKLNKDFLQWNRDVKDTELIKFQLIEEKQAILIWLPMNRVLISTGLLKIFSSSINKQNKEKSRSSNQKSFSQEAFEELVKLHYFLFFRRTHIRSLSFKSIYQLSLGGGIEKDMLIRDLYSRAFSKKQMKDIYRYSEKIQKIKSKQSNQQKSKINLNESLQIDKNKINKGYSILMQDLKKSKKNLNDLNKMSIYYRLQMLQYPTVQKLLQNQ